MPTIGRPRHGPNGSDGADHNRDARLEPVVDAAHLYLLDRSEARDIIEAQVATIRAAWSDACDAQYSRHTSETDSGNGSS